VLSRQYAPDGVTVNTAAIGLFTTEPILTKMLPTEQAQGAAIERIPIG
jgi:NAD(P)-dependent dehydrogenase (short-subunit alcohol dehydrogenase family)